MLAGSDLFVSGLAFAGSVDGAGEPDLLVPVDDGVAVYLAAQGRFERVARVALPLDDPREAGGRLVRHYPIPQRRDLDGDGRPELLVPHPRRGWDETKVLRNLGAGRFGPPTAAAPGLARSPGDGGHPPGGDTSEREIVFLGDLDGNGRAEALTAERREPGDDASLRENLDYARRPRVRFGGLRPGGGSGAGGPAAGGAGHGGALRRRRRRRSVCREGCRTSTATGGSTW